MKRLTALSCLALAASACVDSEAGVRLLGSHTVDAACVPATLQISSGIYALPPPGSPTQRGYIVAFDIESTRTAAPPPQVGGNPVGSTGGGDFIAREQVLTYRSAPDLGLGEQVVPFSYLLREGATTGNYITANLLPAPVIAALDARFAASPAPVSLDVTLQLRGETRSGSDVESNEVHLAIVVSPPANTCDPGTQPAPSSGPCDINGQDTDRITCAAP